MPQRPQDATQRAVILEGVEELWVTEMNVMIVKSQIYTRYLKLELVEALLITGRNILQFCRNASCLWCSNRRKGMLPSDRQMVSIAQSRTCQAHRCHHHVSDKIDDSSDHQN
jgi:hypothetical protein